MPRSATKRKPFAFKIVARVPTREEFERLIDAVGWARYVNRKVLGDHSWFVYVDVEKIDELCGECRANGVTIFEDIADKPYGMREFGIITPDGHRIVFGQPRG